MNLYTANGGSVNVLGTAKVHIANKSANIVTTVIVANNMSHPALISWHDMIRLKMLPSQFPAFTAAVSSTSIQNYIFEKFSNVFKDSLTEEPMRTDPVHIHLKDNYVPYRVTSARQIPLRFREKADECVQELIKKSVIAPCHVPTEWCSPAFFVVKPDGKSVRMVTDYTGLNKYVKRPVHPFSCVTEIIQSIPSTANYFAKFDAVNGYFQIALDEESSMLTTFLLPSGRYRYLRIPQGLNASSDEWCRRSDAVVDGLLWAKKIVDDILIWASTLQELQQRIEIIAQNCERLNVILSKKKFSIGTSMPCQLKTSFWKG